MIAKVRIGVGQEMPHTPPRSGRSRQLWRYSTVHEKTLWPPRSPNLNLYAECFVLCLDRLILLGEKSLTYVLNEYITHYHLEGNHQGIGNTLISPRPDSDKDRERDIKSQERLGGLLKFYHRPAA